MNDSSEHTVTIERDGKEYGASYTSRNGMLHVKTHTEVRSLELKGEDPAVVARQVLAEIVNAQAKH